MPGTIFTVEGPVPKWEVALVQQRISSASTEYLRANVYASSGGVVVDPTSATVEFAFLASDYDPAGADWQAGDWDTTDIGTYVAQMLVGPSGYELSAAVGSYYVWLRLTVTGDDPEELVRQIGKLIVEGDVA